MKKTLAILAMSLGFAAAASATTLSAEYNYNFVANGKPASHYGIVTIAQPTKFGTFDFGIQGSGAVSDRVGALRSSGYEVGYSFPVQAGKFTLVPRVALGAMHDIDPAAAGFSRTARYMTAEIEAQYPLSATVTAYGSYGHTNSLRSPVAFHANRFEAGADFAITKNFTVRAGAAHTRSSTEITNGLVVMTSYSF